MKNKISVNLEVSLVEIIISILIFAVAGAIILNCFAMSRFTQIKANDMIFAGNIVQSGAEMIKSFDSMDEVKEYFTESCADKNEAINDITFINYYDKNWDVCDKQNKVYVVSITIADASINSRKLKDINITAEKSIPYPFIDKGKDVTTLYKINTKKFFSESGRR